MRVRLKTLVWTLAVLLIAIVLVALATWCLIDWTDEGADDYAGGVILRNSSGEILRVSLGEGDVDSRPFYRASPDDWIVRAVIASEDGTFWTHKGVRPLSALRAAFQNVTTGRRISGASTISMQTVRLIKPHPKTLFEKAKEAIRAIKMERQKDKIWILSQYLNRAPFGSNFIGIEAAAQGWFGKRAKDLGLGEAACLAGMVQAPSRFRPDRHLEAALKRRDYVLNRMYALNLATLEQCAAAKSVRPVVRRAPRPFATPFFCDWALAACTNEATVHIGRDVTTTLDADLQAFCDVAVNQAAEAGRYSSAAVVMRVRDGAVVAMSVSGDYFSPDGGQVNTALAPRPAGSTLKPFLVASAMDKGFVTPETRLQDLPRVYRGYRPTNFDGTYRGLVSTRDALILSLNLPFVALLERMGVTSFGATLRALGFRQMTGDDASFGLGMAIGNVEVTLLELVAASATLARGGVYVPPTILPQTNVVSGTRLFSREAAYLVSDILSGDERSDISLGHIAAVNVPRFAWKTGTSAAYRDAWTLAWNPEYVIGVWCGHKSGGFGDETLVGAKASAPVCWEIARRLYPQNKGPWFEEPAGLVRRRVCSKTGLLATRDCVETEEGRAIRDVTPTLPCPGHAQEKTTARLQISRPEAGAEIFLLAGETAQAVVCRIINNPRGRTLWWFADGVFKGESVGAAVFVVDLEAGAHTLTCTTETGETASVSFVVKPCDTPFSR